MPASLLEKHIVRLPYQGLEAPRTAASHDRCNSSQKHWKKGIPDVWIDENHFKLLCPRRRQTNDVGTLLTDEERHLRLNKMLPGDVEKSLRGLPDLFGAIVRTPYSLSTPE